MILSLQRLSSIDELKKFMGLQYNVAGLTDLLSKFQQPNFYFEFLGVSPNADCHAIRFACQNDYQRFKTTWGVPLNNQLTTTQKDLAVKVSQAVEVAYTTLTDQTKLYHYKVSSSQQQRLAQSASSSTANNKNGVLPKKYQEIHKWVTEWTQSRNNIVTPGVRALLLDVLMEKLTTLAKASNLTQQSELNADQFMAMVNLVREYIRKEGYFAKHRDTLDLLLDAYALSCFPIHFDSLVQPLVTPIEKVEPRNFSQGYFKYSEWGIEFVCIDSKGNRSIIALQDLMRSSMEHISRYEPSLVELYGAIAGKLDYVIEQNEKFPTLLEKILSNLELFKLCDCGFIIKKLIEHPSLLTESVCQLLKRHPHFNMAREGKKTYQRIFASSITDPKILRYFLVRPEELLIDFLAIQNPDDIKKFINTNLGKLFQAYQCQNENLLTALQTIIYGLQKPSAELAKALEKMTDDHLFELIAAGMQPAFDIIYPQPVQARLQRILQRLSEEQRNDIGQKNRTDLFAMLCWPTWYNSQKAEFSYRLKQELFLKLVEKGLNGPLATLLGRDPELVLDFPALWGDLQYQSQMAPLSVDEETIRCLVADHRFIPPDENMLVRMAEFRHNDDLIKLLMIYGVTFNPGTSIRPFDTPNLITINRIFRCINPVIADLSKKSQAEFKLSFATIINNQSNINTITVGLWNILNRILGDAGADSSKLIRKMQTAVMTILDSDPSA